MHAHEDSDDEFSKQLAAAITASRELSYAAAPAPAAGPSRLALPADEDPEELEHSEEFRDQLASAMAASLELSYAPAAPPAAAAISLAGPSRLARLDATPAPAAGPSEEPEHSDEFHEQMAAAIAASLEQSYAPAMPASLAGPSRLTQPDTASAPSPAAGPSRLTQQSPSEGIFARLARSEADDRDSIYDELAAAVLSTLRTPTTITKRGRSPEPTPLGELKRARRGISPCGFHTHKGCTDCDFSDESDDEELDRLRTEVRTLLGRYRSPSTTATSPSVSSVLPNTDLLPFSLSTSPDPNSRSFSAPPIEVARRRAAQQLTDAPSVVTPYRTYIDLTADDSSDSDAPGPSTTRSSVPRSATYIDLTDESTSESDVPATPSEVSTFGSSSSTDLQVHGRDDPPRLSASRKGKARVPIDHVDIDLTLDSDVE